ncbi:MAG: hypothetical protein E7102_11615 [Prevotella ruminicola]|uniref:Tetratricopeptide repeat protein n=1 Tax=Xylanibacter ruminicola TaxID=839 RepID=A0A928BUJ3_XYLRU|nr:hypothetical protein [Xylanibacter ruminicola]
MKHLLYIILIGVILISCGGREYAEMQKRLQRLDAYNKSDSAFTTATEAKAVADYFEDHGTPNEQMLAYYLLGRAYYDIHEAPLALNSFQTASEKADTTAEDCDYRQLSRVYGQMSRLFYQQGLMRQSLLYSDKEESSSLQGKDTLNALRGMVGKVAPYKNLMLVDSAIYFCEKASNLAYKYGDRQFAAAVLGSIISNLVDCKSYTKAKLYMDRYEQESGYFDSNQCINKGMESYYYIKGNYYLSIGKTDSAEYYFRKELNEGKDFNNQNGGSRGLALLFQKTHLPDSAAKYALYSYAMNGSVYAHMATKEVEQMQGMYNYSRNQEIARQEKERADNAHIIIQMICVFSFFFMMIAFVIVREVYKKRKEERMEFKNKVSLLAKTQADVIKLRSYGSELSQMLADKEKETICLATEIEKYKERIGQQKLSAESLLENSEVYLLLKKSADKALILSDDDWHQTFMMIIEILPNFNKLISSKRPELNDNEFKTCILIRLHFTSKDVSNMLGVTQPYITKVCRSLMQKLFNEEGKSKDLSEKLKQYS